ncbi:MAG: N-acetylmuramidase domain-containing protein, partial [Muribaculaceae bacterium]|nr:N-acetylmuramidase domain-containing protein [Muribaculaceae bacterium]
MRGLIAGVLFSVSAVCGISGLCADTASPKEMVKTTLDSLPKEDAKTRYTTLTDADFKRVAERLGVEVAAIKAVVVIEAGEKMEGFWAPGVPVVNFDRSMYNRYGT